MTGSGICIVDSITGRKILSTHFQNPLRAALAIESALLSNAPVSWVPNLDNDSRLRGGEDSEGGVIDDGRAWSKRNGGGLAVCQVERNGLRYITPISSEVDPILPLAFLHQLHLVLEGYIGGPVNEASLKDNFDLVLELLEEMLSGGRPTLSEASQLRELVEPPFQLLAKVANVAGLTVSNSQSTGTSLLSSPLPWRRMGIKYNSNEIYFDVTETLSFLLDTSSKVINGSINGEISCRSRLSGMPDLVLSFTDPSQLEDCSFHNSVRYGRWNKDKIVSFMPPDGAFTLLNYKLAPPSSSLASTIPSFSHLHHFLPLKIHPVLTTGSLGSSLSLSLSYLATPTSPISNLKIKFHLGKSISSFNATIIGGAYEKDLGGGKMGGGGAGRWEIEERGEGEGGGSELVWYVGELLASDRMAVLKCQFLNLNGSKPGSAVTLTFDCPSSAFSGLRIAGLKVSSEVYSIYKGVKLRGKGKVEIRC